MEKGLNIPVSPFIGVLDQSVDETEGTADNSASMDSFYPTGTKKGSLWLPF
jgi:hypothetical protein